MIVKEKTNKGGVDRRKGQSEGDREGVIIWRLDAIRKTCVDIESETTE